MATLAAMKRRFEPGQEWDVTNHFLTRIDHPCYGTNRRQIVKVTSGGLWLSHPNYPAGSLVPWPKTAQIQEGPDGAVLFFGGGIGQQPDEPFLTLVPVREGD